jgi:uncharacterized protein (TIGR03435 family)
MIATMRVALVLIGMALIATRAFAATAPPSLQERAFEVATIKPTPSDDRSGRYMTMRGGHQVVIKSYTLKYLVAAAYNIPERAISGGPAWIDTDRYDILATTPSETRPSTDDQLAMLRKLLADRFNLTTHTEAKEFSVYLLTTIDKGTKLKDSAAAPDEPPRLVNTVFPGERISLPARNATMAQFASMLQRAVLDRPVVDRTNLPGRYDFDLEWTPDDTQFGGALPPVAPENAKRPDLFVALQQQVGLKLESSRAPVDTIVIDKVQRPSEN